MAVPIVRSWLRGVMNTTDSSRLLQAAQICLIAPRQSIDANDNVCRITAK